MLIYTECVLIILLFGLLVIAFSHVTLLLPPTLRFYANASLSHFILSIAVTYGLLLSLLERAIGRNGASMWSCCRFFAWMMTRTTGIKAIVEGKEHLSTRPEFLIMNHQTALDVLIFSAFIPKYCTLTAKRILKFVPILGWFGSCVGVIYVDRKKGSGTVDTLKIFASKMGKTEQSVLIFPEGTRSNFSEPNLLPFKKGAFHLAVQAQVPIIPIVTMNYSNIFSLGNRRFDAGEIKIKVLPPIDTSRITTAAMDAFASRVRQQMLDEHLKMI